MVPFVKVSSEQQIKKAKALAAEALALSHFHAVNDDKYNTVYYGAQETKIANE